MKLLRRKHSQDPLTKHYETHYAHFDELVEGLASALRAHGIYGNPRGQVLPRRIERRDGKLILHHPRPTPTEPQPDDELVPVVTVDLRAEEAFRLRELLASNPPDGNE